MKKFLNTIAINVIVLTVLLILLELISGGWFISSNKLDILGIRRNSYNQFKHNYYTEDSISTDYSRDDFGFRGKNIFNHPEKIDILTIGGSTTDQLYISDSLTWQTHLESYLKKAGNSLLIANAGKDGQSTYGHIKNFELWFPEVKNLKPKYILFYIGINDYYAPAESSFDVMGNSHLSFLQKTKRKIKDNSVLYGLYRKVKGLVLAQKVNLGHDKIDFSQYKFDTFPRIGENLTEKYKETNLIPFRKRLKILISHAEKMKAIPIFITQPTAKYRIQSGEVFGVEKSVFNGRMNGVDYYYFLTSLNNVMREECGIKYQVIELTSLPIWKEDDFYDWFHMTPKGEKKVAEQIFEQLKDKMN